MLPELKERRRSNGRSAVVSCAIQDTRCMVVMSDRRLHLWVASGHVGSTRRPNERWLLSVLTVVMPTCFVVHQLASLVVGTRGCNSRCTMWWKQKSTQEGIIPSYRCVTSFFAAHTIGWTIRYASFWFCFFKEWSRLRAEQMVGGTVKKKKRLLLPTLAGPIFGHIILIRPR